MATSSAGAPATTPREDDLPSSVELIPDVVYAARGAQELRLDLFRPRAALGPAPGVVLIHGSRPQGRDKRHYRRLAAQLAERGLVCAAIDYRGPLEASSPAALEDARAAARWLDENAEQHGILRGALGAVGEDFGGYLAAMLGVAGPDDHRPVVGAVVAIQAILDLPTFEPAGSPPYSYALHLYLRRPVAEEPQAWAAASPSTHVDARSAAFLLAHADGHSVPQQQAQLMLRALERAGVAAESFSPAGAGATLARAPEEVPGFVRTASRFLAEALWRPPPGVRRVPDVVYASPGGRDLRLDLYLPEAPVAGGPGVLLFHGGGWAWGGRTDLRQQAAYLAARGYVAACVEYRLSRERTYPAALDDAKAAARWMRANAQAYGVDPTRIAALGMSAGGHLASMLGVTPERPHFEAGDDHAGVSPHVSAVVAIAPVVDLVSFDRLDPWSPRAFMAGRPHEDPARWAEASPTRHVGPHAPPFLFLHGTEDDNVAYGDSVAMQRALEAAGVRAELFTAEGGDHAFFWDHRWRSSAMERIEQFLRSALRAPEDR